MTWLARAIRRFRPERGRILFPAAEDTDPDQFARDMDLPPPRLTHVTFFTPRSGSSWVADILNRSRRLGHVAESFNPNFLPRIARAMNATTLDDYCAVLGRRRQTAGIFGFQITDHQMRAVFGSAEGFLRHYTGTPCFWLVRRDIVLQGVSLYKMQATRIAHANQTNAEAISAREADFHYDAAEIRRWIGHILVAEQGTEALIRAAGLAPLRMSYEQNAALKPNHIVNVMAHHMGLPTLRMKPLVSPHRKIGTDRNDDFAARFRREQADFVARTEAARAPMLEKCGTYGPKPVVRSGRPDGDGA